MTDLANGQAQHFWQRWLLDRLKSGITIAVARSFATNNVQRPAEAFVRMPRRIWNDAGDLDAYFWSMGDASFERRPLGPMDTETVERYHDIRFDPATFTSSAPPVAVVPIAEADKRELSQSDLEAWVAKFIADNPDWTKVMMEAEVKLAFPGHKVARQRLRELLPHRPEGRPRKTST